MIYENDGQKYLLLTPQCQIEKNRQDIEAIINDAVAFNYIGMKVVGQVNTADELPKKADYEVWPFNYGDAFAVGTQDPYNYYLWTRAFGAYLSDHWFNIGVFPGPSTVPGPKGEPGDAGPAPNLTIGTVTSTLSQPQVTIEGTSPNYTLNFKLQKGDKGDPGTNGRNGVDGKNGKDGTNAVIYTVKGAVDTVSQLPVATSVSTDTAYLVKDGSLLYGIIVQNGTNIWYDYGSTSVGPRGPAGVGTTDLNKVQFPEGEHTITFDDTDGLSVFGPGKFSYGTGDNATPNMTVHVPLKAGAGINMGADQSGKFLVINNTDHDAVAGKLDKQTAAAGTEKLYGVSGTSQEMYTVDAENANASTIVKRRTDGSILAKTTTATDKSGFTYKKSVVNNETLDTALAKKLDKQTTGASTVKLYGVSGDTQYMYQVSGHNAEASTIVMRGADGGAVFNQGKALKHAVILNTIEPVIISPNPSTATTGTVSDEQLNRLRQTNLSSVNTKPGILMNNEYYVPMDKEHKTGVLGYTYFGYENNKFIAKNIKITISTKKWTLYTNDMQPLLYSGVNIKTVNGESLIGSGNIEIQGGGSNIPAVGIANGSSGDILDDYSFKVLEDAYNNRKFSLLYQEINTGSFTYYSYAGQWSDSDNFGHMLFNYIDDENGEISSINYNVATGHWTKINTSISTTKAIPNDGPTDADGNPVPGITVNTYYTGTTQVTDIVSIALVIQLSPTEDAVFKCVVPSNMFGFSSPYNSDYNPTIFGNPSITEMPGSGWILKNLNVMWDGIKTVLTFRMGQGSGSNPGVFRINFRV